MSEAEILKVNWISVQGKGITNLKGVEYFTALTELDCSNNQLMTLDISKNTSLEYLGCFENQLTTLDINKNTVLTELDCSNNQLMTLDVSKNTSLETLDCQINQLSILDVSKNTSLKWFLCSNNQLNTLDVSKNVLLKLLSCSSNLLNTLEISQNVLLEWLECGNNQLSILNVNQNILLEHLACDGNQLSTLDVSKNTLLTDLYCSSNQLSALDVSKITSLERFHCGNNQLSILDVSKNTSLMHLSCDNNQLSTLNINQNVSLRSLDCDNNPLSILDVSKNTSLMHLSCDNNQLSTLDVSKNTSLIYLSCCNNQLSTLDVSKNVLLEELCCIWNKLNTLDMSQNTALLRLVCFGNGLTELRLSYESYGKLMLNRSNLHSEAVLFNFSNVAEKDGIITVNDITKPGTYKYSHFGINNGTPINFTIFYGDVTGSIKKEDNSVKSYCSRLFNDYEYKNLVSGTAITIYGNGTTQTINGIKVNNKEFIAYTNILASYNYSVDNKGKVKSSTGKVIVGITMSDTKPTVTKNKIVDNNAAKIAKAKIKNGQITVTATGKAGGVVYLWVMDTGSKGVSECCPINVKLAPKKLEVQEITGSKANKFKIENGKSKEVKIAGFVGTIKTEDCAYTVTVNSKYQNYVDVTPVVGSTNQFAVSAKGLKNNKDTKVSITFQCNENGKKVKFTVTITKSTVN